MGEIYLLTDDIYFRIGFEALFITRDNYVSQSLLDDGVLTCSPLINTP